MTEIKGTLHTCQCNDILKGSIATNAVKIRNKNHWQISHFILKVAVIKKSKAKLILVVILPP